MSEQAATRMDAALRQLLQSPTPSRNEATRWSNTGFRLALGLAQALQVGAVGAATMAALVQPSQIAPVAALGLVGIGALVAVLLQHEAGVDPLERNGRAGRAAAATLAAVVLVGAWLLVALPGDGSQRLPILVWSLAWGGLAAGAAAATQLAAARLAQRLDLGRGVLLVGPRDWIERTRRRLSAGPGHAWRLAAAVDDRDRTALAQATDPTAARRVDVVLVSVDTARDPARLQDLLDYLADQRVRMCVAFDLPPRCVRPQGEGVIAGIPVVELVAPCQSGWPGMAKRGLDIVVSLVALVLVAAVLALAAVAIAIESPGPVLFRQWRFGAGSRPFLMLKLRTMRPADGDPTGATRTTRRDPRVTRLGRILRRASIDELPQLINVLRGEMSLVGPRPHPLHMRVGDDYFFEAVERYRARHAVRPGLTGWAQLNGSRGEVDTLEKARRRVELDLWYIENWSLALDLRILVRTALGGFLSLRAD
ncbi:exopolysaccharide biosynthesis polyprenyl glycosylphosphotransferase [Roseicella aerolata]|uniref:Exopolysaccharide biosynthesis polyprenyl glycosylphosphotransferase n=1 Tax=Roseicella aerolata TaxID=2883479 RepID=A0A9X1IKK9_9PROT|nr:exopolysaccharide biosynthesis polyprenyl glycosylphosphotransferase [Roseicella aerolata]MCB4825118.1 exopolysaccharide biosynthesis polyprenyl glycosylphosphotransferase [Roseicella aerolata]